jgi:catechol 2,3-dioxygenase-like lactoylglutathione lyase family enzyme
MLKRISHTFLYVLDQDEALDFYVGKLGMVVHTDADLGAMRFLTVNLPEQPDVELVLMVPGMPVHDEATAAAVRELVTKGAAGGGVIFETDDCQGTYERLRDAGVEFTQEPVERFYGTDCALRDPFGNPIRFTQPPDGPVVVPSVEELRAARQGA